MSIIKGVGFFPDGAAGANAAAAQHTDTRAPLGELVRRAVRGRATPAHLIERPSGMHFAAFAGHARPSTLGFEAISPRATEGHAVAPGYRTQILAKSGDDIGLGDAPVLIGFRPSESEAYKGGQTGTLFCLSENARGSELIALDIDRPDGRWRVTAHRTGAADAPRAGWLTAWRTVVVGGDAGFASESGDGVELRRLPDLGTLTHVGFAGALNRDGRNVLYFADAGPQGCLYRMVALPKAMSPLDGATLSVARFDGDGSIAWLPLIWGTGPLGIAGGLPNPQHLFQETAFAAMRVGATPAAGLRDLAVNPANGRLYVLFDAGADTAILEILPPENEHAADRFRWTPFVGADAEIPALNQGAGLSTDPAGRLWIARDGMGSGPETCAAALLACDADGPGRARTQAFFRAPAGTRLSAPAFSPDGTAMFVAVAKPENRGAWGWPDFTPDVPARAAVLVITRDDDGLIGS